jgi:hypothetical protein
MSKGHNPKAIPRIQYISRVPKMTDLIATVALAFIEVEPRMTYESAIAAAMLSLGFSESGVSVHSIIN